MHWNTVLRERLGELARSRRSGSVVEGDGHAEDSSNGVSDVDAESPRRRLRTEPHADTFVAAGVEEFLPGGEWRDERGAVYVHERLRSAIEKPQGHWGRLGVPPEEEEGLSALASLGLDRAWFVDLETGGFASSPVFLAGTMHWNGTDFVIRQYFARHYGEEGALLRALDQEARQFEFIVTFNGKSYDAPFLMNRAVVHGESLVLPPRHLDLLHPSRRKWKTLLPNCRLQTLESYVCRRRRWGDVPSEEVPGLYHDYVRRGDPYRLIPVFHHNMLDVITMGEVLGALCQPREVEEEREEVGAWESSPGRSYEVVRDEGLLDF